MRAVKPRLRGAGWVTALSVGLASALIVADRLRCRDRDGADGAELPGGREVTGANGGEPGAHGTASGSDGAQTGADGAYPGANVARVLSAFGATLREEVKLPQLTEQLAAAVRELLDPAYVLTWLKGPVGYRLAQAPGAPPPPVGETLFTATVDPGDNLVTDLWAAGGPVPAATLDAGSPAAQRFINAGVALLVPMVCQGRLLGWLALGPRPEGRAYTDNDLALLDGLAAQAGPAFRVAQLVGEHEREVAAREQLDHELSFAQSVQKALLPKQPPTIPGWQIAVHWQPARAVGGDFYDFLALPDSPLVIAIADVADKGVPAALIMATTRSILRGHARSQQPPDRALARTNELLLPELTPGMFVTCLYALLDTDTGRLTYANAGHNPPYLRRRSGAVELWTAGMALGLLPDVQYDVRETVIAPGETLLLYSDGLTEAHNEAGEMFGIDRIHTLLEAHDGDAATLVDAILAELAAFAGSGWVQEDDVTLMALHRAETGGALHGV